MIGGAPLNVLQEPRWQTAHYCWIGEVFPPYFLYNDEQKGHLECMYVQSFTLITNVRAGALVMLNEQLSGLGNSAGALPEPSTQMPA